MIHIFTALIPIFSLIMIGYFFKRIKFPSYEFWPQADRLTYYILMPSLLIYKLSNASFNSDESVMFVLTALITISILWIIMLIWMKISSFKADAFTSMVQGTIRFNTYVFLALIDSVLGDKGIVFAAILLTFVIPYINILCISTFALYTSEKKLNFFYLLKSIITNPLIIACFIGGAISFINIEVPLVINKILSIISAAALPMGLLSVGFGLVIKEINSAKKEIFVTNIGKFILKPVIMYITGVFLGLDSYLLTILIIFAVLPTAPSSFVLARQLKGDVNLMSSIITVETLLSIGTIIIVLQFFVK